MKFRLGVNYWPADAAMYWWRRFDLARVARDFARIRSAGFDSVRIFLLWEDFQPQPQLVDASRLEQLVAVADAATVQGLSLVPTLFTGHMSGVNWLPQWALRAGGTTGRFRIYSGGRIVEATARNWFEEPEIGQAQAMLASAVAGALRGHPSLWAYDLGNENSNVCIPASRESGLVWLREMANAIHAADPVHPITIGLHMEDLEQDRKIGPAEAGTVCDFLCMHGYPIYASWAHGATDALLLPFLALITGWLGKQGVLFEEFGAATRLAHRSKTGWAGVQPASSPQTPVLLDERAAARFTREALGLLHRCGCIGAMLWCFADYEPALWSEPPLDQAPHERSFGLWRSDGSSKPALRPVADASAWERVQSIVDLSWIDVPFGQFYEAPLANLKRLYSRFRERYRLE